MIRREVVNGIRIIHEPLPFLPSCALGLIFNLGSRDETEDLNGATHFIEHTLFKGTKKRSARDISLYAESLGAHLDGFTARESTGLYARFLKEFTRDVLKLTIEIVTSPLFPEEAMEKEKGVVYQEIREAEEDPEDKVFSLLFANFFPSHPLGFPITGTYETVKGFSRGKILTYFLKNYTTNNIIFVLTGGEEDGLFDILCEETSALSTVTGEPTGGTKKEGRRPPPLFSSPWVYVERRKELESVYLIEAKPCSAYNSEKRYALSVLNTAFGGSLSSRLFQRLREEEGLVYQITSFVDLHSDCGIFGVYFVTSKEDTPQAIKILHEVRERLRREKFSSKEIEVALNLTKSSLTLSQESPLARMFALARNELLLGRSLTLEEVLAQYNQVKLEDVNSLLDEILAPPFSIVAVGDINESDIKRFL